MEVRQKDCTGICRCRPDGYIAQDETYKVLGEIYYTCPVCQRQFITWRDIKIGRIMACDMRWYAIATIKTSPGRMNSEDI